MKRIIAFTLAALMAVLLAACGEKNNEPDTSAEPGTVDTDVSVEADSSEKNDSAVAATIGGIEFEATLDLLPIETVSASRVTISPDFASAVLGVQSIDSLEAADIEFFVQLKDDIVTELTDAFRAAGITVDINKETGEMSMDSTVIFGGDSAVLSDEGKDYLNKFIRAYAGVVFSEEYEGYISELRVEGHTAPVAGTSYEDDIPLSQERADNVKNFCISEETGVSAANLEKLADMLVAEGLSNGTPVKDSAGNVDMDASRRVSFRFIFDVDAR